MKAHAEEISTKLNALSKAPEMIFVKVTAEHPTHAADRTSNLSGNFRFSGIQNERPYYKVWCKGSANKSPKITHILNSENIKI